MGKITGERTVEIDAPIERVFAIAADVANSPRWQGSLTRADVVSTGADGRAEVVETTSDAKVKSVRAKMRFAYDEPSGMSWDQIEGDTKAARGWWRFEALDGDRTRATYGLEVDPGRVLGLLVRGPVQDQVKNMLLGNAAEGLKREAEQTG